MDLAVLRQEVLENYGIRQCSDAWLKELANRGVVRSYESQIRAALEALARPGETVLELGGGIGVVAGFCEAKLGLSVATFEPDHANFLLLCDLVHSNQLTRVVAFNKAIVGITDETNLYNTVLLGGRGPHARVVESSHPGAVAVHAMNFGQAYKTAERVFAHPSWIASSPGSSGHDILVMDIEGSEWEIIERWKELLQTFRLIIVECHLIHQDLAFSLDLGFGFENYNVLRYGRQVMVLERQECQARD